MLHTDPFAELAGLTLRRNALDAELRNGTGMHGGGGLRASLPALAKAAPNPSVLYAVLKCYANRKEKRVEGSTQSCLVTNVFCRVEGIG